MNEHFEDDGAIVFREACRLGCEGIVSKRLGSLGTFGALGKGQISEGTRGETRSRRRLGR
jgi:hypothetical protein